jgi:2-(1,2-epoxy-1,2-dihydrophenyl)acetyl-CoA isomerase
MHVADEAGVRTITFDRPAAMNAMSLDAVEKLRDAVAEVGVESHDAVVLAGEGPAFSAGGDVQAMADREERPAETYERLSETFGALAETMLTSPVPVVARVHGDAVGAGLALVALSDYAYAAESAAFSCAFVRVGLVPDAGGTYLLPRLVGLRAAKRLAFSGERFDAAEAADLDLVNEAVPDEDLDDRLETLLDRLREAPTRTIGLTKRAFHANLGREFRDGLDRENLLQVQAAASPEHEEGVAAFLEGREPEFR